MNRRNDLELGCRLFGAEIDLFFALASEKKLTSSDERVYVPVETSMW